MPNEPEEKNEKMGAEGKSDASSVNTSSTAAAANQPFKPTTVSDRAATADAPESQLAKAEAEKEEVENRRTRLSSDLLQQKHKLIENFGWLMLVVIVGMYLIFALTLGSLLLSGKAFNHDIPVTAVVLVGMSGSVPTILSISLMVGLLAKEKDASKDEKSAFDTGTLAKACIEVAKHLKAPH